MRIEAAAVRDTAAPNTPAPGASGPQTRPGAPGPLAVSLLAAALVAWSVPAAAEPATVKHDGKTIMLERTLDDPRDLWIVPDDLTRINGFVLKPEGACLDEICIPIRQDRDSDVLVARSGQQWFNLTAFARKIKQTFTVDYDRRLWTFGPLPFKKAAKTPRK